MDYEQLCSLADALPSLGLKQVNVAVKDDKGRFPIIYIIKFDERGKPDNWDCISSGLAHSIHTDASTICDALVGKRFLDDENYWENWESRFEYQFALVY